MNFYRQKSVPVTTFVITLALWCIYTKKGNFIRPHNAPGAKVSTVIVTVTDIGTCKYPLGK